MAKPASTSPSATRPTEARDAAIYHAEEFNAAGYHKQIVNRMLEPFSHIKVVCTATEYDNFFYLRCHPDAQPEIQKLAELMYDAREASTPVKLNPGSWHVPYFEDGFWIGSEYNEMDGVTSATGATLDVAHGSANFGNDKIEISVLT
jgi:hypothetical protein